MRRSWIVDAIARALVLAITGALGLAASACGAGEAPRRIVVERTDSAGVEIVTSPGEDLELAWNARPLFTLGGKEEGPESFYSIAPGTVDVDRDGRLYLLDLNAARVTVFDTTGELLRLQGGEGGGPGESLSPNGIAVSPEGEVSVFDFGKGGLVRFAADGTVLPELPFREFPTWSKQRHFAVAGSGYAVSANAISPLAERRTHQLRRLVEDTVTTLAELEPVELRQLLVDRCGGGIRRAPIFAPDLIWDAQAERIAANSEPGYTVTIFEHGRPLSSIRRAIEPSPATRALAFTEVAEGLAMTFGHGPCNITPQELVDGLGFAEIVPIILNVRLAHDGTLWVERRADGGAAGSRIDLFDPTGAYLGTLPPDTPFPVLLMPGGRMAVIEKDEFDVARLVIMVAEPRGLVGNR
jgi:hypothetical protein